jgi:chromosomal replication initiation ATPase DnaA
MNRLPVTDHCQTAADVMALARLVNGRRRIQYEQIIRITPLEKADAAEVRARFFMWPMAREVARQVGIDAELLRGTGRQRKGGKSAMPIAQYRQLAMALALHLTGKGISAVGHVYRCDHTTVLHAQRRMEHIIQSVGMTEDNSLREWVAACLPHLFAHMEGIRKNGRRTSGMWSSNDRSK